MCFQPVSFSSSPSLLLVSLSVHFSQQFLLVFEFFAKDQRSSRALFFFFRFEFVNTLALDYVFALTLSEEFPKQN